MAWHWLGGKPVSEPMMVDFLTHMYAPPGLSELNGHQRGDVTPRYIMLM